jgi:predicted small secreted protein
MKTLSSVVSLLAIAATVSLSACSTTMGPGETASATPPRLVSGASGVSTTNAVAWDRPDAFGPVPADLRAKGQAACDRLEGGWTPTGYHPMAQLADGSTSPSGGYYCQRR